MSQTPTLLHQPGSQTPPVLTDGMPTKGDTGQARFVQFIKLFLNLFLAWLLLNGSFAADVLAVGAITSLIIALLFQDSLSPLTELRLTPKALFMTLAYLAYFAKELIKSNLNIARIVISPNLPVRPGIVKVNTQLKSRIGRLMLANSITLTPGTLTVHVGDDWLYVHCVTVESDEIETATANIVAGFERYLLVMYG